MKERLLKSVGSVRLPVNLIVYMKTPFSLAYVGPSRLSPPSPQLGVYTFLPGACWRAVPLNLLALGDRFEFRVMSGSFPEAVLEGPNSRCLRGQSEL